MSNSTGLQFTFVGAAAYTPPTGHAVDFEYPVTNSVYPDGFNATLFGTAHLPYTQQLHPSGVLHSSYGTHLAKLHRQYAYAVGTKFGTFGAVDLFNRNRYLRTNGSKFDTFGSFRTHYTHLTPVGFKATQFGTAYVRLWKQYIYTDSMYDRRFGSATYVMNENRRIYGAGFIGSAFGRPSMSPLTLGPVGIAPFGWTYNHQTLVGNSRVTSASVGDSQRFGVPFASYNPRYINVPSLPEMCHFGTPPYGVMHKFNQNIGVTLGDTLVFEHDDWDYRMGIRMWQIDYIRPAAETMTQFGVGGATQ